MKMYKVTNNGEYIGKYKEKMEALTDIFEMFKMGKGCEIYGNDREGIAVKNGRIVDSCMIEEEEI